MSTPDDARVEAEASTTEAGETQPGNPGVSGWRARRRAMRAARLEARRRKQLRLLEKRAAERARRLERAERMRAARAHRARELGAQRSPPERRGPVADRRSGAGAAANGTDLSARIEELESRLTAAERRASVQAAVSLRAETVDEPIDLARASFEELRGVGLSVTQATRVLEHRERRQLRDLEDLEHLPGFPAGLRAALKQRVYVGAER